MLWPEQNLPCNNRTSAAKAAHAQEVYGTAEQVAEKLLLLKGTGFSPYVSD